MKVFVDMDGLITFLLLSGLSGFVFYVIARIAQWDEDHPKKIK